MKDTFDLPAIGDDRAGIAEELLRLAKLPGNAEKGGLVMQLQTAANVLLRADVAIGELSHQLTLYQRFAAYCRSCALSGEYDPKDFDTFKRTQ